jgi:hypothetical protein
METTRSGRIGARPDRLLWKSRGLKKRGLTPFFQG